MVSNAIECPVCSSTFNIETVIATISPNLLLCDWDWEKFHNLVYNRNGITSSIIVIAFSLHLQIILILSFPPFS
jgi:hypothetical protein